MNKLFLILISMVFFAAGCNNNATVNQQPNTDQPVKNIAVIGNHRIDIEIARTGAEQNKGLGGRDSLPENNGMLFVFPVEGKYPFWMKEMRFALDFIWIKDNKIVEITANVLHQPNVADTELKLYYPANPVDSMLEVNAGFTSKNGIKVGDSINLTTE
jgi:uncharacterized protein